MHTRSLLYEVSLLTVKELANELNVSVKTVRRLTNSGRIPYLAIGRENRYDLLAVKSALTCIAEPRQSVVKFSPRKRVNQPSRFADAVGV
jgi:excisionase family DNA binding protein